MQASPLAPHTYAAPVRGQDHRADRFQVGPGGKLAAFRAATGPLRQRLTPAREALGALAPGADPEAVAAALLAAYEGGVLLAGAADDLEALRLALGSVAATALAPEAVA